MKVFEPPELPRYSGGVCGLDDELDEDEGLVGADAYFDEAILSVRCDKSDKLAFYLEKTERKGHLNSQWKSLLTKSYLCVRVEQLESTVFRIRQ